jgi:hypothetical protein
MTLCGPMPGSIVISPMSSTTILGGLMNGSTCMIEVFINVCCASSSGMMIWINGVFELLGGEHFYGTHWLHGRVFTWDCWNMYNLGGCIRHLNKSCQTMACLDLHHHCQTLELTKPLDHTTILKKSSLGNSKGLCLISSPLGSSDVMGLGLVIRFHLHFINIRHWVFRQHISLLPCRGVGAKSISKELAISVYVHQILHLTKY